MSGPEAERALYVAWEDRDQRRHHTVGRLLRWQASDHPQFEFTYVRGAQQASQSGFQPFLAFPDLDLVYRSDELFPLFANRLISKGRPDYSEYVKRLGLNPNTANEMMILGRSGGVRATDSLVLFPFPFQERTSLCYLTYFLAHDIPMLAHERVAKLAKADPLPALFDLNRGIALRTEDSVLVGYLPVYLLGDVMELAQACGYIEVFVEQVNPPPAPIQQRLLCRLRSCWPTGFVPFSNPTFQPIPTEAADLSSMVKAVITAGPTPLQPDMSSPLFATFIENGAGKSIRLPYRDGAWSADGITVFADRVQVNGSSYSIQSRNPFYADLVHEGRRIVITG